MREDAAETVAERRCVACHTRYDGNERFCSLDGGAIVVTTTTGPDLHIGRTIAGRYLVRRLLGRGGMGAVYEADHVGLDKRVAIKFLLGRDASPATLARFRREARAASKIVHEHVVQIFDVGSDEGVEYIVMEYLEGCDLRRALADDSPFEPARVASIGVQILRGLQAIHDADIVHRDIKPANILLTTRGSTTDFVKIMDFGISKSATAGPALTDTGHVVGTPQYMAPEQLLGHPIDGRADLYAVALTLYELVSGTLPFTGTSTVELATKQLTTTPRSLHELRPGLPDGLVAAIERALEKEPADRFGDALAFAAALGDDTADPSRHIATVVERKTPRPSAPERAPARLRSPPTARRWLLLGIPLLATAIALVVMVVREDTRGAPSASSAVASGSSATNDLARHLQYARDAERDGQYEIAIAAYTAANHLEPAAERVRRIAELYERLGKPADATATYRHYLAVAPNADDRGDVEAKLIALAPAPEPTAPIDAGANAGTDAGDTDASARTSPIRRPPVTTTKATKQCVCRVWVANHPIELCKTLTTPRCRCQSGLTALCPVPTEGIHQCPDYNQAESARGQPCGGYQPRPGRPGTPPQRVPGVMICSACPDLANRWFRGEADQKCTGLHPETQERIDGVFACVD